MKLDTTKKRLIFVLSGLVTAIPFLVVFVRYFPEYIDKLPPCPSTYMFKIYCPGCGSTRAMYCLLTGNLYGVIRNNIFTVPALLLVAVIFFYPKIMKKHIMFHVFWILLLIFTILRNLPYYPFNLLAPAGL